MSHRFFQNTACEYFPCHEGAEKESFNCLFCFCPLYALGESCGGNFTYTQNGIKDCSHCHVPHHKENYDAICSRFSEIARLCQKSQTDRQT
ncbi:MAG: metal-binding protein [Ruminococcaceae bacterium]|nr:metal-binding protein [Oscillospiraceae bacterium]